MPAPALRRSDPTKGPWAGSGNRRRTVTISRPSLIAAGAAAVVLVLVVAGFAIVVLVAGPSAAASETSLEPVNTPQANPFLPQNGGTDTPGVTSPHGASGPVGGNTPGLFGGSGSNTCQREGIASFLAGNPDMGSAWAEAEGVEPSQIGDFLSHLSPLVLRADTAVTNYGYADGHLTSRPAILQSGTAVLVDGYGTPRVKCYCGNPLTDPPHDLPTRFEGTAWPTFVQVNIVVVQPAPVVINNLTVVNVVTNNTYMINPPPWRYGHPPAPRLMTSSGTPTTTSTTSPTTSTTDLAPGYGTADDRAPGTAGNGCLTNGALADTATAPPDADGSLNAPSRCGAPGRSTTSHPTSTTTTTRMTSTTNSSRSSTSTTRR